jgi:N-acetyl-anhydromuramyl-L-alanine amidase AmpD
VLPVLTPKWVGSPNFTTGRRTYRPTAIVIHIAEGSTAAVDSWFRNPASKVSAHYLVTKEGELHQYVREEDTAWHAGRVHEPTWKGLIAGVNPNLYTIGIEHEGKGDDAWPNLMYERSARLLAEIHCRWGIPIDRAYVVGHREIFARKSCPGSMVDLAGLVTRARGIMGTP